MKLSKEYCQLLSLLILVLTDQPAVAQGAQAIWQDTIPGFYPSELALDPRGNAIITGKQSTPQASSSLLTVMYAPDGTQVWSRRFDEGLVQPAGLAVDARGAIYVAGSSKVALDFDLVVIKYSPTGHELWRRRYDGAVQNYDYAHDVQVDREGNAYVAAVSYNGASYDVILVKISAAGKIAWTATHDTGGDDSLPGFGQDLLVDASGNSYLIARDVLIKYSSAGETLWQRPGQASAVTFDQQGRIVTTSPHLSRCFTVEGKLIWEAMTGGTRVDAGPGGHLWITSSLIRENRHWDLRTLRLSDVGAVLWERTYDNGGFDGAHDIAVDQEGNAYITGRSDSKKGLLQVYSADMLTIKYDGQGRQAWTVRLPHDTGEVVAVTKAKQLLVLGASGAVIQFSAVTKIAVIRRASQQHLRCVTLRETSPTSLTIQQRACGRVLDFEQLWGEYTIKVELDRTSQPPRLKLLWTIQR